MITQNTTYLQEIPDDVLDFLLSVPAALVGKENCIYLLVRDLSEEMETFLQTGKTNKMELHVFAKEYEREQICYWRQMGFTCKYRSQRMEYMYSSMTINFLQICNPATGVKISLIPWFMLPGRPYPIFTYLYAIWHYNHSEQKSMRLSALAAGKLFGIENLNKGTICRNIKAFQNIIESCGIDKPLLADEPKQLSSDDMISRVPEILMNCNSVKDLESLFEGKTGTLPEPVSRVLNAIPHEFEIIRNKKSTDKVQVKSSGTRKRQRRKKPHRVNPTTHFVEDWLIARTRTAFIKLCRAMVLDATLTYHRFLI